MIVFVAGGDLPDIGFAENVSELSGSEGIHFVVGSAGNKLTDAGEFEVLLRVLGENICADGVEAIHACRRNVLITRVQQNDGMAILEESLGDFARPAVSSAKRTPLAFLAARPRRWASGVAMSP